MNWRVECGDSRELLRTLADNSVDALVTDPPAGIEFLGLEFDTFREGKRSKAWAQGGRDGNDGFGGFAKTLRPAFCSQTRDDMWNFAEYLAEIMREVYRVLKPGAHGFVWALPRTSHWTALALEAAGFEIRDCVQHLFSTGFPKALDVSKAIDATLGAEREVVGVTDRTAHTGMTSGRLVGGVGERECLTVTAPATDEAKQWDGWKSALKPSSEFWWLVRKPLDGTIAENVLAHGTGVLNIAACRIGTDDTRSPSGERPNANWGMGAGVLAGSACGRYPSHTLMSHADECGVECVDGCPVAELDRQSGVSSTPNRVTQGRRSTSAVPFGSDCIREVECYGDTGGASRFFTAFRYQPKPTRFEKEAGCGDLQKRTLHRVNSGGLENEPRFAPVEYANVHPTCKPVALMRWLCKLITPPDGIVLDPFAGSGTTGVAAIEEGFSFVGFEKESAYAEIARARCEHAARKPRQMGLPL